MDIALGSTKEAENHLAFVHDMGWIDRATFAVLDGELTEVRRMLFTLERIVRQRVERGERKNGSSSTGDSREEEGGSFEA